VEISIVADTRKLEDALYLLAKEARVAPGQVIREESRLFAEQIVKLTPPASLAQGRGAVARDFYRAVGVLDKNSFAKAKQEIREPMRELIRRKDNATLEHALNEMDNRGWRVKPFVKTDHTARRNKYGRVPRKSFVMTTDATAARRHLRLKQQMVGWAKGAWVAVIRATGGRVSSWYGRHESLAGYAKTNFGENPSVLAVARNIKIPGYQRMVDSALATRERITERKINRLIAGKATNLGFVTILERK
jgi:hypothetical protein